LTFGGIRNPAAQQIKKVTIVKDRAGTGNRIITAHVILPNPDKPELKIED